MTSSQHANDDKSSQHATDDNSNQHATNDKSLTVDGTGRFAIKPPVPVLLADTASLHYTRLHATDNKSRQHATDKKSN